MQKKLGNYDTLKQNNEKVKEDLKTKRQEFNKVNSSYNRVKKIVDKLRAGSKRPTSKKDREEGVITYYRDHPKARGNRLWMNDEYDEVFSALDGAQRTNNNEIKTSTNWIRRTAQGRLENCNTQWPCRRRNYSRRN